MNNAAAAMHLKSAVRENRSPERGRHSQPGGFPTTNELFSGEPAGVVIFILASEPAFMSAVGAPDSNESCLRKSKEEVGRTKSKK